MRDIVSTRSVRTNERMNERTRREDSPKTYAFADSLRWRRHDKFVLRPHMVLVLRCSPVQ